MVNGADLVVMQLKAEGVTWVSTLCGNGMNPFYEACRRLGMRVVDTHNEQAAAYIADGYARLTGRLGVCAVSSGIAHCNALTGMANAYFDGAPVLLITGASAGYGAGRGVFQEFDQVGLADPICKYSQMVPKVEDLRFILGKAISMALAPESGPVHLTIPSDVLQDEVQISSDPSSVATPSRCQADDAAVGLAIQMIRDSERPVLVAGTGLFFSGGQAALVRFSEAFGVPFVVPIWDRGCVEGPHRNFMGVIGAASGQPRLLEDADMIITAGAAADYRLGYLAPPMVQQQARVIRIDSDSERLGGGARDDLRIHGDPAKLLERLAGAGKPSDQRSSWLELCRSRWEEFRQPWITEAPSKPSMTGRDIVESIRPILSEDLLLLIDGGNIGQWAHMALADQYPGRWLTCGASAVVGWGIPGAMGARLAEPDKPILLLSGDGAFGFTITELESAVRQDLPFVAVVANDSGWGIVVCGQRQAWGSTVACETCEIRFDQVAEALGAKGMRINKPSRLTTAIKEAFSDGVPTVIDVPIQVYSPTDAKRELADV